MFTFLQTKQLNNGMKWQISETLQNHREKGEQNLIVKYVKDIPKIISTTKN